MGNRGPGSLHDRDDEVNALLEFSEFWNGTELFSEPKPLVQSTIPNFNHGYFHGFNAPPQLYQVPAPYYHHHLC